MNNIIHRTPAQKIEFIKINHHLMTAMEMSEEIDLTLNSVYAYCREFNWNPITEADRRKEFILSNTHQVDEKIISNFTIEELMKKFCVTDVSVRRDAKELNIKVLTDGQKAIINREKEILPMIENLKNSPLRLLPKDWPQEIKDYIYETTGVNIDEHPIREPIREAYTQTGSAILDELRGIQTTGRVDNKDSEKF